MITMNIMEKSFLISNFGTFMLVEKEMLVYDIIIPNKKWSLKRIIITVYCIVIFIAFALHL